MEINEQASMSSDMQLYAFTSRVPKHSASLLHMGAAPANKWPKRITNSEQGEGGGVVVVGGGGLF